MVHLVGFITKKFVTMHGHVNVKFVFVHFDCAYICKIALELSHLCASVINSELSRFIFL